MADKRTTQRHPHVINVEEVEASASTRGSRFSYRRRPLGRAAGGNHLGCSWMEVPPGKAAWPRHFHAANEEAIFILEGSGEMRLGEERVPVRAGDYVALPIGPGAAHQLVNTGTRALVYLCVSTMLPTDVSVYPDSGKIGVFAGAAPGGNPEQRFASGFFPQSSSVDYFHGEDDEV